MKPFDSYPNDGIRPLPTLQGANTRRVDAPKLQRLTRQTQCAYCGVDLTPTFEQWLLTSIDHVVPTEEAQRLGIVRRFFDSMSNAVLCCSGCNGFQNRYKVPSTAPREIATFREFCELRDLVFSERRGLILEQRKKEIAFFETSPWIPRGVDVGSA